MRRLAFLLPLVAFAAFLTPAPSASAATTYYSELLRFTNAQRAKYHLPAYKVSYCLKGRFADPWARHMSAVRKISHQPLSPMMTQCNGNAAGENVAYGNVTPARMVEMWMASPGHRANILSTRYTHIGIGASRGTDHAVYGVQDFLRVA